MPPAAQITTADGQPISGVSALTLSMSANGRAEAALEIAVGAVDVRAHPLLGLDTIRAAAALHGYRLVEYKAPVLIGTGIRKGFG